MDGNTSMEDLEQHLLFHKALADDGESLRRMGGYMSILSKAGEGERLSDPVDESIRAVFSLVLENGIDPWEVDLSEFARLYESKVAGDRFDMIVAGKLMLMAWRILRMQSESTRIRSEPPVEQPVEEIDDSFFYDDDQLFVPEVSFKETYARTPERPVTVFELIDAFEDARKEMEVQKERERVRAQLKAKEPRKFENKAHDEDDERDVEAVWQRIERLGAGQIGMDDLFVGNLKDDLTTFVAVLHLVRDGRLDVWQDSLPSGRIYIEILTERSSGMIEDSEKSIRAVERFGRQGSSRGGALLEPRGDGDIGDSREDRVPGGGGPHSSPRSEEGLRRPRFRDSDRQDRFRIPHDAALRIRGLHGQVRKGRDPVRSDEDPRYDRLQPAGPPIGSGQDPRSSRL